MLRTLLTALLIVTLTYFCLMFTQWDFNPAHWSVLSRAILIIMFVLSILKPLVDAIAGKQAKAAEEFVERKKAERNQSFDGE